MNLKVKVKMHDQLVYWKLEEIEDRSIKSEIILLKHSND